MDSLSSSTSQRSLSDATSSLVAYLSRDDRDNHQWLNIRPHILNDLNTVVCEGPLSGYSPLSFLASRHGGEQLLINDEVLRGKITAGGLNTVIVEGLDNGKSALYFLTGNPQGPRLLKNDEVLRGKITSAGLNAVIAQGLLRGISVLLHLAIFSEGRQLLIDDAVLRAKITDVGLNAVVAEGPLGGKSALLYLAGFSEGRQLLIDDEVLRAKITDVGLNAVIAEGEEKGESALYLLACNPKGRQLLIYDEVLRSKITVAGLNAVIAGGEYKGKSALYFLACYPEGRQLLIDDKDLRGKITAEGLNAIVVEGEYKGYSALWFLASSPDGWSLLREQKSLYENISLKGLVSTFLHDNNDGSSKRYSVLAYILEDKNKHAILFDNAHIMADIIRFINLRLTLLVNSSQEADDYMVGDHVVKLLLENTPGRFSTILSSQSISSDNFRTYLNMNPDMINVMAKSLDGRSMIKEFITFYPKKPHNGFFVPDNVRQEIKDAFTDNLDIVTDQVSQDIVINPVKITQEDCNIHEYRDIYWWLLVHRTHPITRKPVALEVGQDPDDVLVFDEVKMQAIKELLKTWLHENMHEKLVDIIKDQNGIDFLLAFSDTVKNLDVSVLQQSIVDGESTLTIAEYLQRSKRGKELSRVIGIDNGRNSPISICGFFDDDTGVDQNPSRSNNLK